MNASDSSDAGPSEALGTPWDAVLSLVYFVAMPLLCHLVLVGSLRIENRFSRGFVRLEVARGRPGTDDDDDDAATT